MGLLALGLVLSGLVPGPDDAHAAQRTARGRVDVIELNGLVDPVMVDFVGRALDAAEAGRSQALVIQLDSPGVVAPTGSYEALIGRMARSAVPVVVWVGPSGATARGRVARLLRTAPLVMRAPGSSIEAEAFLPKAAVAPTLGDVVVQLDGRRLLDGGPVLRTARVVQRDGVPRREPTVEVRFRKPGLAARLLHTAASPAVAYLFLLIAALLVLFELFTAGVGVAAVVGAAFGVLGGYGLAVLPVRLWALGLIAFAFVGLAVDVQAGAPRAWTVMGTLTLAIGTVGLYGGVQLPPVAMAAGVVGVVLAVVGGMPAMIRARFSTPTIGREGLVGAIGRALVPVAPDGTVELHGAPWRARTNRATPIGPGEEVRVVSIDGLVLEVEPTEGAARDAGH